MGHRRMMKAAVFVEPGRGPSACARRPVRGLAGESCVIGIDRRPERLRMIEGGRVDLAPLVTHRFRLDDIESAYELFGHQRDGVLKVAVTP